MKKPLRAGNAVCGKCKDCGKLFFFRDDYIVRPSVWAKAGMDYHGGYLHRECLERRLGRKLLSEEVLMWVGRCGIGGIKLGMTDEGWAFALACA